MRKKATVVGPSIVVFIAAGIAGIAIVPTDPAVRAIHRGAVGAAAETSIVTAAAGAGMARAAAQPDFSAEWPALVERIERAHIGGDLQDLRSARADCRRLLDAAAAGPPRAQLRYALAYVNWRLLNHPDVTDGDERDDLGDEAVELLRENIAADDADVEAHALLGAVYGRQITSMWRGMTLGRRASAALDTAREIDERNPRFLLIKGVEMYHRPGMMGGGADDAEPWLRAAVGFFEAQPADPPWPNWGRADAYAWLGRTLAALDDEAGAREQYEKALAVEPDFDWVREVLLPRLR